MSISAYGLQHFNFYRVILQSPHVRHEWFKIGLAATVGELAVKSELLRRHRDLVLRLLYDHCSFTVDFATIHSTSWRQSLCGNI